MPEQDTIRKVVTYLDKSTSNNYIFEGEKMQRVLEEIRDIEQEPIEGGGYFEAIFIRFRTK